MPPVSFFEAAAPEGLEALVYEELRTRLGGPISLRHALERFPGVVQFDYTGKPEKLLGLRTVLSLFWGLRFDVPRPRALLGHQNLQALLARVDEVLRLSPRGSFKSLHLAAAGSESAVMQRLAEEIAGHARLSLAREEADLLVRVRPPLDGSPGWEALVRMAPRPLSVRRWRVCDLEGALNAAVAQAAVMLTRPRREDVFLNLACGSGTLLIERAAHSPAARLLGCDVAPEALACARQNIAGAGMDRRIQVYPWDARALPLESASVDVICADLPFGLDVGSHDENVALYPALLAEAARAARPKARGVFITQEVRLMGDLLAASPDWALEKVLPVGITGLRPRIYVVERRPVNA
jgi:23S rRNA G2445 N2-methylase RlmL